ncbi:MAG: 5-(carboxyamino)imidazole ribonucleotide synthase [Flavobacteriales bacterium]
MLLYPSTLIKLGILGGGQLGRMMIREAIRYPIEIHVLDPDPQAPCAHLCDFFTCGSFADYDTVLQFGRQVDVLTIEIEHVNVEALMQLSDEGIKIFPQADVIALIQDKGLQKEFYTQHQIPTSPYLLIEHKKSLQTLDDSWFPAFLKMRKMGYDGKGVMAVQSAKDWEKAFDVPMVLEKAVDLETELAVIVAVSHDGEIRSYPPVDMAFNAQANLVEFLYVPSRLPTKVLDEAVSIAERVARELGIIGLLAVEMFLDKSGNLMVNEIAPRAHNSGHHTFEACETSQFEQLLRAVCGLPLGATQLKTPAVMVNLLGEEGHQGEAAYAHLHEIMRLEGVHLHLYGKKITKPYRKMGHATITDASLDKAIEKARYVKNTLKIIT